MAGVHERPRSPTSDGTIVKEIFIKEEQEDGPEVHVEADTAAMI